MTHRERFARTLRCEKIGGQVPTFELVFFLTMEAFGQVHPSHRAYSQWYQMSFAEQTAQLRNMAKLYVDTARRYGHSAIFVHPNPEGLEPTRRLLEEIREIDGGEYSLMMHGDSTLKIPSGEGMMDFTVCMYENPESLHEETRRKMERRLSFASRINESAKLLDGFALCSDYCFNTNPFFTPEQFDEFIAPYLRQTIAEYRQMGFYTIKHSDGNILPILAQIAQCGPDAIHSLDPQGGVSLTKAREIVGPDVCLIGNVNCGLLQTGTDEECRADVLRALREGMENGRGYIFSTSNCVYTGMPLRRYEMMIELWRQCGRYPS